MCQSASFMKWRHNKTSLLQNNTWHETNWTWFDREQWSSQCAVIFYCGLAGTGGRGLHEYPSPGNPTCPWGGSSPPPLPMHHTLAPPLAAAIVLQHHSCHLLALLLWYLLKISKQTEPSMRHLKAEKHWFYVSMQHNPIPPPPFGMSFILSLSVAPARSLCAGREREWESEGVKQD